MICRAPFRRLAHRLIRPVRFALAAAPLPATFGAATQAAAFFALPELVLGFMLQSVAVCCWADARARCRDAQRLERAMARFGPQERLLRSASSSRCQRDAALCAAARVGCAEQARRYYRSLGYRWRHILPDHAWRNPLAMLHPRFLTVTFIPRARR